MGGESAVKLSAQRRWVKARRGVCERGLFPGVRTNFGTWTAPLSLAFSAFLGILSVQMLSWYTPPPPPPFFCLFYREKLGVGVVAALLCQLDKLKMKKVSPSGAFFNILYPQEGSWAGRGNSGSKVK